MAYYPISRFPVEDIRVPEGPRPLRVDTLVGDRVVPLVEGWPVEYSEQKIAFLQRDGRELVIDRNSIWRLAYLDEPTTPAAPAKPLADRFVHPQAAGFCSEGETMAEDGHRVFPQQFLNDEVVIKRELDRLQEGLALVAQYENDQKFYPVPQLHGNRTSLGFWLAAGSRHGTSDRRGRLSPLVIDELSMGPFRFQHLFLTGITPNPSLLHEEPQTQLYYRFKAAYFHASVMLDPGIVLMGEKYLWRGTDLDPRADVRLSEIFAIDLGFDLGPLSLQFFPIVLSDVGMRVDNQFHSEAFNLWRIGPRLTFRQVEADAFVGWTTQGQVKHRYGRLNVSGWIARRARVSGSIIFRGQDARVYNAQDIEPDGLTSSVFPGEFNAKTWVYALQATVPLGHRFAVAASLSLEHFRAEWGDTSRIGVTRNSPKAASFVSFAF
jgi:hypothetical protein